MSAIGTGRWLIVFLSSGAKVFRLREFFLFKVQPLRSIAKFDFVNFTLELHQVVETMPVV
jgi:hypothetical protein